ncbi:hypothetical protein DID80_04960 [Candidatus Marinamargulisbacteria bacterium SCGC AAA071-K20]|nr:hypothetical protein DID80_04960 [Candidatus Marinamargulisbacteria bacterium SCGC AAA071-K20]
MKNLVNNSSSLSTNRLFDKIKTTEQESTWFYNFFNDNTKKTYLRSVQQFCQFLGIQNKEELRDVQPAHVIAFRDFLEKEGLKKTTIGNRLSGLSSLYDDLVKNQIIKYNPVSSVRRPKYVNDKVLSLRLTEPQMIEMLDKPDQTTLIGLRDWVYLSILFGTGCRISEVCNLSVKDNFQDGEFHILRFTVKGGKEHTVAINPTLQSRINQYLDMSGHRIETDAPLLQSYSRRNSGGNTNITTITGTRIWDKYKVLEGSTPHSSRTTFASEAIRRGEHLANVQDTLAHADPRTTQKYNKNEFNYHNSVALGARI